MKKLTTNLVLVSILLAGFFISCKKDKKSKTEVLTQSEWSIAKVEEKTNTDPWEDDVPNWPACEKDDKISFKTNKSYEINEGLTKCDPADPQVSETGTWEFGSEEAKLLLNGDEFTIDVLNDHSLVLSASESVGGDTYYSRITFAR